MPNQYTGPSKYAPLRGRVVYELVADCLARRARKSTIRKLLEKLYGGRIRFEEFETTLKRGRAILRIRAGISKQDAVAETVGFYEEIIRDDEIPLDYKMKAQLALRELLGLDATKDDSNRDPREIADEIRQHLEELDNLHEYGDVEEEAGERAGAGSAG